MVQEGHFHIDSTGRDDEKGNIGILGIAIVFVCWGIIGVILTFGFSMTEEATDFVGTKQNTTNQNEIRKSK